jgi:HEAT repeat protein
MTNTPALAQVAPLAPKWLAGTPTPPVETFADGLTRRHIDLSEAALIAALANPDGEVRSLAAAQLAAMDDHPALTAILDAMEAELDLQVQVNLAGAASWLDSRRALDRLQRLCQNLNVPSVTRLDAARYVSNKELPTCFSAVEQVEQSDRDAGIRVLALATAVNYPGQGDRAQALAISALTDRDPTVRIAAVESLRVLHATGAVDAVRRALQVEGDDTTREHLRAAIPALQHTDPAH